MGGMAEKKVKRPDRPPAAMMARVPELWNFDRLYDEVIRYGCPFRRGRCNSDGFGAKFARVAIVRVDPKAKSAEKWSRPYFHWKYGGVVFTGLQNQKLVSPLVPLTTMREVMGSLSTFLFARPSVWEGAGRLVDFGNFLNDYNYSPSGEQADDLALWADWTSVGNDIRSAWIQSLMEGRKNSIEQQDVEAIKAR